MILAKKSSSFHSSAEEHLNYLVTADSFLPHSGGSRVYYANLYESLLAQFPDTVTILTKKIAGWQEFDQRARTERFRVKRSFKPLPNWGYAQLPKFVPPFLQAGVQILARKYDSLHCGDLFPQALNGVILRALSGIPLLVFCHGDEISQTDKRRLQPKVRDFIYRNADALIAANQFAKEGLLRIGIPEKRIHKLTPGVDIKRFQPLAPSLELIDRYRLRGKKVLLTVARLVPRKGHQVVIRALPIVLQEIPDLHYLIVGAGAERNNLAKIVRELNLDDAVTFAGDVPHERISEFYNLCDVFIMANRLEPEGDVESFGMVFTEANAVGKPVIGGKSGGASEAIVEGVTGYLVDPNSREQVADRLLKLFRSADLRKTMGSAGLSRVMTEFNWTDRARQLREICAELSERAVICPRGNNRPAGGKDSSRVDIA
jgi:phosphatidylinositol alpha-1,6-mannosyltransferase